MKFCKKCGEYRTDPNPCGCTEFTVTDEDGEDHKIHEMSKSDAALSYAKSSNSKHDNYLIDNPVVVSVDGTEYEIGAELDINYSAMEI